MATIRRAQSNQALDIAVIDMTQSESVTVSFESNTGSKVVWDDGGISWTINPTTAGNSVSVAVEHSLLGEGDDAKYWTPDSESPFSGGSEGNEHFRVQRVRFTATTGQATVVVASGAKFRVLD